MFFLFLTFTFEILEFTKNLTIEQYNTNYDKTLEIPSTDFTYITNGDKDGHPFTKTFDNENTYWISKDTSTGNSKSAFVIYFKKTVSLEKILLYAAFSTNGNKRTYSGYPLVVNVFASLNNGPFQLNSIFTGPEPKVPSWGNGAQFSFTDPIVCDRLKVEFEEVTPDTFFGTNDECAIARTIIFLGRPSPDQLTFEKVNGLYSNETYVNLNSVPTDHFIYESNGDNPSYPIKNAFDISFKSYWVAKEETTDSFHSTITITFTGPKTIDAILYDPSFQTKTERIFMGFPLKMNVYTAMDNGQLGLQAVFSGTPVGNQWNRTQFVFNKPITCQKLQIEFVEVTPEAIWSNSKKCAVASGFIFMSVNYTSLNKSYNNAYIKSHRIPTSYFNYSSTESRDDKPLKNIFDDSNSYWVPKNANTDSFRNSITIDFNRPVFLDALLLSHAYSTSGANRAYHGFPLKLNILTSIGQESLSLKYVFESEAPTLAAFGPISQFSFRNRIICDRLQLEFIDVTLDSSFSKLKVPVLNELHILGEIAPDPFTFVGVYGSYADSSFLQDFMIDGSSLTTTSTGDKSDKPLSNAFDSYSNTYWVSDKENTATFKSSIVVDFNKEQTIAAFLYDSAFRTRDGTNKNKIRYFDGFPNILTVSVSPDGSDVFYTEAIFSGEPIWPWERTQFVFHKPITCRKIKLEFTNVTKDDSFSDGKQCAASAGIYFMKESYRFPSIPNIDGIYEVPPNQCNTHYRCDVNITSNNVITVDLRKSSFNKFTSNNNGGAISLINCGTLFESGSFNECTSRKGGGAIFFQNNLAQENKLELIDITFNNCSAAYGGAAYIYSKEALVRIMGCNFNEAKLLNSQEITDHFNNGSALFLTVKKGEFQQLSFDRCEEVVVKFYNNFNVKPSSKVLSAGSKGLVTFSHCTFKFEKVSNSLIYYVRGNNPDSLVKVSDCRFVGEIEKGVNAIDGLVLNTNSPRLVVESCKFSSMIDDGFGFVKSNQALSYVTSMKEGSYDSLRSILIAVAPAALVAAIAIIIAALVYRKRYSNDDVDGMNPSENQA